MTKDQDTRRIILSRTTLHAYQRMADAGAFPKRDLSLIADEIAILKGIIDVYPAKSETLGNLIGKWEALRGSVTN